MTFSPAGTGGGHRLSAPGRWFAADAITDNGMKLADLEPPLESYVDALKSVDDRGKPIIACV